MSDYAPLKWSGVAKDSEVVSRLMHLKVAAGGSGSESAALERGLREGCSSG